MATFLRSFCAPLLVLLSLAGCGGATREDRTITFSGTGDNVGFQHGTEGVFVADKDGGGLLKIFTPDKDVIAVGTPLWAPKDKRLIFTTAIAAPEKQSVGPVQFDVLVNHPPPPEDPAGRVFVQQPAVYTCWLRDEMKGGDVPEPHVLFTASVDHVGYVAAGLAVRWHPQGDRILYVKQVGSGHAVFEFNLRTKKSHRVFPQEDTARAIVFDWSPDGSHLVCVVAFNRPNQDHDGIWVGHNGADFWHVAESGSLASGEFDSALEVLKAARPAWTTDGSRFAFASWLPGPGPNDARHALRLLTMPDRRVATLLEAPAPIHDLAWRPDGKRLGFITGGDTGELRLSDLKGGVTTVTRRPVRSLAGWDATGAWLAYTTADVMPLKDERGYSMMLFADPLARDMLWLAPGDGSDPGRIVASGLRTTFAHWSPRDKELSLWFTFSPTHRSLFSMGFGWGLRSGDPAATIDASTGRISWMAVTTNEKAQVGHYFLLKRNYAEAWRWYEEADRVRPAEPEPKPEASGWDVFRARPFRETSLFEYYCLEKLGRHDEAQTRLDTFRKKARQLLPSDEQLKQFMFGKPGEQGDQAVNEELHRLTALARDCYAAEVFLSLDAAADGEQFFRRQMTKAVDGDDRFSAAIMLSQLLLLQGRTADYAALILDTIAPALPKRGGVDPGLDDPQLRPSLLVVVSALAPLGRDDLLAPVPRGRLEALAAQAEEARAKAGHDAVRLVADLVLDQAYRFLGRDKEMKAARQRWQGNPMAQQLRVKVVSGDDYVKVRADALKMFDELGRLLRF